MFVNALTKTKSSHTRPGTPPGRAFTLVELIAVLVLIGIVSATAIPALSTTDRTRHASAARLAAADLKFARQHAVATGLPIWVQFNTAANEWSIKTENSQSPGRTNAQLLIDPATERQMIQNLDTLIAGERLLSANFDGANEIGFDWLGRPLAISENALVAPGSITLESGYVINIAPDSGLISITTP